jgi:hypothetical protein
MMRNGCAGTAWKRSNQISDLPSHLSASQNVTEKDSRHGPTPSGEFSVSNGGFKHETPVGSLSHSLSRIGGSVGSIGFFPVRP